MERSEKIFVMLLGTALIAVVLIELRSRNQAAQTAATGVATQPVADSAPVAPEIGPAYLTINTPGFNPGPPVYNLMPSLAAGVSTQNAGGNSSCNSCG
jgi:hypothetical protein